METRPTPEELKWALSGPHSIGDWAGAWTHEDAKETIDFLSAEVRALQEEIKAERQRPQKDCGVSKCGHNSYWTTHYGDCMACSRASAEKERDEAMDEVRRTRELCPHSTHYSSAQELLNATLCGENENLREDIEQAESKLAAVEKERGIHEIGSRRNAGLLAKAESKLAQQQLVVDKLRTLIAESQQITRGLQTNFNGTELQWVSDILARFEASSQEALSLVQAG